MDVKVVVQDKYKPQYANETDACMDIRAAIHNTQFEEWTDYNCRIMTADGKIAPTVYTSTETSTIIPPGETRIIGTGLQVAVPFGQEMKMHVRSSTGIKKNLALANGTGIIDAGYRDEVKMALHNFGKQCQIINDGDRICQFEIQPVQKLNLIQVEDDEEFRNGDRGGGIGSTGTK